MPRILPRKDRLEELIALAQTYRGWSQKDLAQHLGRDQHNMVPGSGVPKLDLVLRLAEALDWPVEMVIADLCSDPPPEPERDSAPRAAKDLNAEAWAAYNRDEWERVVQLTSRVAAGTGSADQKTYARLLEAWAWEGMGRYTNSVESLQAGLRTCGGVGSLAPWLQGSLASAYYALGHLVEASSIATALEVELHPLPASDPLRHVLGHALYVRGSCGRVLCCVCTPPDMARARRAILDLERAIQVLGDWRGHSGAVREEATAEACRGAIVELRALTGELDAEEAVEACLAAIEPAASEEAPRRWLEARGWWCIFGSNIAMRHVESAERRERLLAVFTNMADAIAEKLGNWALREQVWTIEHARRQMMEHGTMASAEWNLDAEDIRNLAGAMGRFPAFRPTGWQVLHAVRRERRAQS